MGLKVITPGLLTTIQDVGRYGFRKDGIIVSGAMDTVAFRIANLLVGNNENEAAIEITLAGPEILFEEDHLIGICGADLSPEIDRQAVKLWRPVFIKRGSVLSFGRPRFGCRAYLAVAGGMDIPKVMDSASTYLRAAIGGWKGRALRAGDVIPSGSLAKKEELIRRIAISSPGAGPFTQARWTPSPLLYPKYTDSPIIRATTGPEWDWFTARSKESFWEETFLLTPQSDRMGLRLEGPTLSLKEKRELLSTAVTFGTVQVPEKGNPIVLMADHPTTGGYPRVAQVIKADLPLLAQLAPGKKIKFKKVTLQEAQQLLILQEQHIFLIKKALSTKTGAGINE